MFGRPKGGCGGGQHRADAAHPAQAGGLTHLHADAPHGSPIWRRSYAQRGILGRINDGFRFERHNIRGKDKMTARVASWHWRSWWRLRSAASALTSTLANTAKPKPALKGAKPLLRRVGRTPDACGSTKTGPFSGRRCENPLLQIPKSATAQKISKGVDNPSQRGRVSNDKGRFQPQEWTLFRPSTRDGNRSHHSGGPLRRGYDGQGRDAKPIISVATTALGFEVRDGQQHGWRGEGFEKRGLRQSIWATFSAARVLVGGPEPAQRSTRLEAVGPSAAEMVWLPHVCRLLLGCPQLISAIAVCGLAAFGDFTRGRHADGAVCRPDMVPPVATAGDGWRRR